MTRISKFSVRHALSALVISMAVSAPVLADDWRQCPYSNFPDSSCCYQRGPGMQGGDWPMMRAPMWRQDMPNRMAPAAMEGKQLGVMVSNLPNPMLDAAGLNYGVNVESVQDDSAAAKAGIQAGDVITEFNGSPVYSTNRLRWLVSKAEAGKSLIIKLIREKQPLEVNATLVAPKPQCPEAAKPTTGT